MDPEQRLFVIHKYLAVKFLVILIGTFTWIFGPERIGIVEWYRTFYNLYLVLGRRNFYDFFFALVVFFFLAKNARMPVKEIAEKVALTSPAVSSRIHKLETDGIISGYTVMLNRPADRVYVDALISLSVAPSQRDELVELMQNSKEVLQCYHVTGAYTFLIKVSCGSMPQLEHLILQFQKLGTTSTQIILSTPVNHGDLEAMML